MEWRVEILQADEKGQEFYLKSFKPFRLSSLQLDPQAFSSTFKREAAFDDSQWLARLQNPLATTFVACEVDTREVLSCLTLMRLPLPPIAPDSEESEESEGSTTAHWAVYGVYTLPRARRRGVALAVMDEASRWARDAAAADGKCRVVLTVEPYKSNANAQSLYRKAGFVTTTEGSEGGDSMRLQLSLPILQSTERDLDTS